MKKLSELKPVYQELLAAQHIIATVFGIPYADLYVGHAPVAGGGYLLEVIAKQGDRSPTIGIAHVDIDAETFRREWNDVVAVHNAAPFGERDAVTLQSKVRDRAARLIEGMLIAGLRKDDRGT